MANKVRLVIEFRTRLEMLEWMADARNCGALPNQARIYMTDGLDFRGPSALTPGNAFIVRREGERPDRFELTEEKLS